MYLSTHVYFRKVSSTEARNKNIVTRCFLFTPLWFPHAAHHCSIWACHPCSDTLDIIFCACNKCKSSAILVSFVHFFCVQWYLVYWHYGRQSTLINRMTSQTSSLQEHNSIVIFINTSKQLHFQEQSHWCYILAYVSAIRSVLLFWLDVFSQNIHCKL